MFFWCRSLFALSQNATSGEWTNEEICLGGPDQCHNGLIGRHFGHVLSFAEDTDGGHPALAQLDVLVLHLRVSLVCYDCPTKRPE